MALSILLTHNKIGFCLFVPSLPPVEYIFLVVLEKEHWKATLNGEINNVRYKHIGFICDISFQASLYACPIAHPANYHPKF